MFLISVEREGLLLLVLAGYGRVAKVGAYGVGAGFEPSFGSEMMMSTSWDG
jgi:hypothetical protein